MANMANKISLAIRFNEKAFKSGKLTKPYLVSIPRSLNDGVRGSKSFATKDDARRWADDFARGLVKGGRVEAQLQGPSVGEKWDDYSDAAKIGRSKRQVQNLDYFGPKITAGLGSVPMKLLSVRAIEKWLISMQKEYKWSKRTVFNAFSALRTFVRWAKRRKYIDHDPTEELGEEIRKPASSKTIISALEMKILLHCTKRDRMLRAFLVFGGFAGIRTKEIQGMDWANCDWDGGEIHVPPSAIKETKERGGMAERYVKMQPAFLANIPRHLDGNIIPVSRRVFESRRQDLKGRAVRLMNRLQERQGVKFDLLKWEDWPDNCLRHTYASCLLASSKNAHMVAHEMGHQGVKTLLREYARALKEREAFAFLALKVPFLNHGEPTQERRKIIPISEAAA